MEKKLIIVKPGTLKPKDKEKLTKAGNIVIEHPEPYTGVIIKDQKDVVEYQIINCIVCGDRIYLTKERKSALLASKKSFYCPQGHSQSY